MASVEGVYFMDLCRVPFLTETHLQSECPSRLLSPTLRLLPSLRAYNHGLVSLQHPDAEPEKDRPPLTTCSPALLVLSRV